MGIRRGIAVIDGTDPRLDTAAHDIFYLLVNHQIGATQGLERDDVSAGSFLAAATWAYSFS